MLIEGPLQHLYMPGRYLESILLLYTVEELVCLTYFISDMNHWVLSYGPKFVHDTFC